MSSASSSTADKIRDAVRNVPDFPKSGIQFKDITPVLADAGLFRDSVTEICGDLKHGDIDTVVGIDARGFIFGSAVALHLDAGFVPVRKKGKLPWETHEESYSLEYGTNTVAIHTDAVKKGERVLLVDDLLATGGTAAAALKLLDKLEAVIVDVVFLVELPFLDGRKLLGDDRPVRSIVTF